MSPVVPQQENDIVTQELGIILPHFNSIFRHWLFIFWYKKDGAAKDIELLFCLSLKGRHVS